MRVCVCLCVCSVMHTCVQIYHNFYSDLCDLKLHNNII